MSEVTLEDGHQSRTGQDIPLGYVLSRPASSLRPAGHGGTLSRPVPLSRPRFAEQQHLRAPSPWLAFIVPSLQEAA
jgi:hypothetical protein